MKFAHLVEINDPLYPLIAPLSRVQLWRGLLLRTENPRLFVPWLDECRIVERCEQSMKRALRYGELVVRDEVTLLPPSQVWIRVPAQGDIPLSSLIMTIEEPVAGALFVRFEYDTDKAPAALEGEDAFYEEYRRAAYIDADVEAIRTIRSLLAQGKLDSA